MSKRERFTESHFRGNWYARSNIICQKWSHCAKVMTGKIMLEIMFKK